MIPKEKAKELMLRYYVYDLDNDKQWYVANKFAKNCALIAVDEIIEVILSDEYYCSLILKYWQEVKQEIEKL